MGDVPTTVKAAIGLLITGIAPNWIVSFTRPGFEVGPTSVVGFIVGTGIGFLILRGIYQGRNWLRVLFTVVAGLGAVLVLVDLATGLVGYTWLDLIGVVINAVAVVLLWLAPSRSYFDAMKAARAATAPQEEPPSEGWKLPYSGD